MAKIDFNGATVEYDEAAFDRWDVSKAFAYVRNAQYSDDPKVKAQAEVKALEAYDAILCGRSDEVAEAVGGTASAMNDLIGAIVEKAQKGSERAKN